MYRWRLAACSTALALLVLATLALGKWRPYLTQVRPEISSTPSLIGLFARSEVPLRPRQSACIRPVNFDPDTTSASFVVTGDVRPEGALIALTVGERRIAARRTIVARGDPRAVTGVFAKMGRRVAASVCIRNAGTKRFALVGTAEARSRGLATTYVNGRPQAAGVALTLATGNAASIADQNGRARERASLLTGTFVPPWAIAGLMAILALLVLMLFAGFLVATARDMRME